MFKRFPEKVRKAFEYCKRSLFLSVVLVPLAVAAPPIIVGLRDHLKPAKDFFESHPAIEFFCAIWPLLLIPVAYVDRVVSRSFSVEQLALILTLLANVVGKKYRAIIGLRKQPVANRKDALFNAAQPDQQIADIVHAVWMYFYESRGDRKADIRVSLAQMGAQHIEAFECFSPADKPPKSDVPSLRNHDSCFSTAKRVKDIVVVEDVAAEVRKESGRRFHRTQVAEGGIICFPLWDEVSSDIPLVISVCTTAAGDFKESRRGIYKSVLEQFGQRIMLEYHLRALKKESV